MAMKRLAAEHTNLQGDPLEGCSASPTSETDIHHWTGTITGPPGSAYAGGRFHLDFTAPEKYPREGWLVKFTTPIFHPNVSAEGDVGLGEMERSQWSPAFTLRTVLLSLQSVLSDPELTEACILNPEAAVMLRDDGELFAQTAREWTEACAEKATTG